MMEDSVEWREAEQLASNPDNTAVDTFFLSYRKAFERSDATAIAGHFAYPVHVTSDGDDVVLQAVASEDEWREQIERLLGVYAQVGVRWAHIVDRAAVQLSPRLHHVLIQWVLHDAADQLLYEFEASYTVADFDGDMRITAVAHNEQPRLRDCLARRRRGTRGEGYGT